jgi:hypothetical protein
VDEIVITTLRTTTAGGAPHNTFHEINPTSYRLLVDRYRLYSFAKLHIALISIKRGISLKLTYRVENS